MLLKRNYAETLPDATSKVSPSPLANMQGRLFNTSLANTLILPESLQNNVNLVDELKNKNSSVSQNSVAQKYGGHQFGGWNPDLGDGRGLLLGEVANSAGNLIDLHLKGAGQTPYSRFADGRAVLRSTLREYIAGEALHAMGIPSSRSLSLITSDSNVQRESIEPAAMMIRTAPSHIRFGHFEYFHHADKPKIVNTLMDFCLEHHFTSCANAENPYYGLFESIVKRTAKLIALWQAYGFVHGVMNTDNMSIHGITFDFGPYAFQGAFKANAVFNHSDHQGRYAFDQQPSIGLWNCYALSEGFTRHLNKTQIQGILDSYEPALVEQYRSTMLKRMGLFDTSNDINEHWPLAMSFLQCIAKQSLDYNQAFIWLTQARQLNNIDLIRNNLVDITALDDWWPQYIEASINGICDMHNTNPQVIPRTSHLEQLIEAANQNDWQQIQQAIACYSAPFNKISHEMKWLTVPEQHQSHQLSCSS